MKRAALFFALVVNPTFLFAQSHGPDIPDSLSFQGQLTKPDGTPVDTSVVMTFQLYKDGSPVWSRGFLVDVADGVFDVILEGTGVNSLNRVAFDAPMELGVTIGGDSQIVPRIQLTSSPFALATRGQYAVWEDDGFHQGYNIVAGAPNQFVEDGVVGATIGGGGGIVFSASAADSVTGDFGTVSGGLGNRSDNRGVVGGGSWNRAVGSAHSTVAGGDGNLSSGQHSTVGGGHENIAASPFSTVGGGDANKAMNWVATVGGGWNNLASGQRSTVPGGSWNEATGGFSFAAGMRARAHHNGAFVWADSTNGYSGTPFTSTGENQFLIRASGGVGIGTNAPKGQLHVAGNLYALGHVFLHAYEGDGSSGTAYLQARDMSGSSTIGLTLRTQDAGTIKDAVAIAANGSVGIGTDAPARLLHIRGDQGVIRVDREEGQGATSILLHQYDTGAPDVAWKSFAINVDAAGLNDGTFKIQDLQAAVGGGGTIYDRLTIANNGDVDIPGNLSKGGGSFKIDHPLDPENKYLYHSFVESPDMMNVYNGNVVLDGDGQATIELPSYFEALNRDFRYQLTAIGSPGPNLFVSKKIEGDRFAIAGGSPGMEVSWQVTGIRKDPYAEHHRIEVEVDKPAGERGTYLHPDAYGSSAGTDMP